MSNKTTLTKQEILTADDLAIEWVDVPEWGGGVYVRTLRGDERDAFGQAITKDGEADLFNYRAKISALTIVDADGERLFSESDAAALGQKSSLALNRVVEVAERLSGFTVEAQQELEKNCSTDPTDDSLSD